MSPEDPQDPTRPDAGNSAPAYAQAGVDLDHDEGFIDEIKDIARGTARSEILSGIGGFAGLFKAPDRYREPIFVAGTDGVGTKLKLAAQVGRFDTIGIDCVAMVVNDLIVQGAEPLVFLDYLAMGKLDIAQAKEALKGVAEGCRRAGCALLGGETATMPGFYPPGELELVGFGVGVVERTKVIDGSSIRAGDVLLGLGSSGFHSNGYALVRQVAEAAVAAGKLDWKGENEELNTTLASALIAPTKIYVKPVLNLLRDFPIHGIVHVTGGGFAGNIPRVLPQTVRAVVDPTSWPKPTVMSIIQRFGEISEKEMLRVFNCGVGMVLVVPNDAADEMTQRLVAMGERVWKIGYTEQKDGPDDPSLVLSPEPRDLP
ncbi:MAG: phosphoribosylformylglycinamidine cyclo-ligase [Deltaproteobacteria bacterium]|nr:phosphoribosylformylglycinamidine cyclo-ligase [Deltaproteobacteria bacterium]MBW2444744.1 phosphoribosylformylglycinamidine cyclo-ligase [Deltaproteobacteria bacterium]